MSMMRFRCPKCHVALKAASEKAGQRSKCPKCQTPLAIPKLPAPEATSAPPAGAKADEATGSGNAPLSESEIEELANQVMTANGIAVSDLLKLRERTAKLAQCGTSAAPIIRKVLVSTRMTNGFHFDNAATLCRVLGEVGGPVAKETLEFLARADSKVGEFYKVKKAATEALQVLAAKGIHPADTPAKSVTGHCYQGRVPQRGEGVICFACGKTFDGHGPVLVDIMGRERWFCPEKKCMDKIGEVFAGKCTWCEKPLPTAGPQITGSSMGDNFCSEPCRESCGRATGNAQRRMGLW